MKQKRELAGIARELRHEIQMQSIDSHLLIHSAFKDVCKNQLPPGTSVDRLKRLVRRYLHRPNAESFAHENNFLQLFDCLASMAGFKQLPQEEIVRLVEKEASLHGFASKDRFSNYSLLRIWVQDRLPESSLAADVGGQHLVRPLEDPIFGFIRRWIDQMLQQTAGSLRRRTGILEQQGGEGQSGDDAVAFRQVVLAYQTWDDTTLQLKLFNTGEWAINRLNRLVRPGEWAINRLNRFVRPGEWAINRLNRLVRPGSAKCST
jgi:hypothetical protein